MAKSANKPGASRGESRDDAKRDTSRVKSGVRQHESALHKGQPKTKLKLK